jgi:hypothetical protein
MKLKESKLRSIIREELFSEIGGFSYGFSYEVRMKQVGDRNAKMVNPKEYGWSPESAASIMKGGLMDRRTAKQFADFLQERNPNAVVGVYDRSGERIYRPTVYK